MTDATGKSATLNLAWRRAIACVAILAFLVGYVWVVASIASLLPDNQLIHLAYYAVAGILWGVPILPVISWSESYKKKH